MSTLQVKVTKKVLAEIAAEAKRRGVTSEQVAMERLQRPTNTSLWDRMKHLVIKTTMPLAIFPQTRSTWKIWEEPF